MKAAPDKLQQLITRILRPVASLLLRNGVAFADFSAIARKVFVDVAAEEFSLPGRKQSVSRVSLLTGINRKDVKKLLEQDSAPGASGTSVENNRAARVISAWLRDPDYHDEHGQPGALNWGRNADHGFEALVRQHSGDIPARAVLDELLRVGAVAMPQADTVQLLAHGYVPGNSDDELQRLSAESAGDLMETIKHNLDPEKSVSRLQLSVAYDDLPEQSVELFRHLSTEKGRELLIQLDQFLSTQDRSTNPSVKGDGRYRAGLGIYYFEQNLHNPEDQNDAG